MKEKKIISKYLGIPYKHMGRTIEGYDCWGFILDAYKDMGYKLWDVGEDYEIGWSKKGRNYFLENYYKEWKRVGMPNFLDVILFLNDKGIAHHAGIYLSHGKFIHCCRVGVIISRLSDTCWKDKVEGFYRLNAKEN